jgi:putative ABC transport system substrate-binding protein
LGLLTTSPGSVTGFTHFGEDTASKWLELLREVAPGVRRVAVLVDPRNATSDLYTRSIEGAASSLGLPLTLARAREPTEIEQVIASLAHEPNLGLIVPPGPFVNVHRELILKLASRHRLPAVYPWRYLAIRWPDVLRAGFVQYVSPDGVIR